MDDRWFLTYFPLNRIQNLKRTPCKIKGVLFVEIDRKLEYDKDNIYDRRANMSEKIKKPTKTNSSKRSVRGSSHVEHRAHPDGRITNGKPTGKPTKDK